MLLHCPRVEAVFAAEGISLEHDGPAWLHWDEHGGTYILKVGELKVKEGGEGKDEAGIFLEVELAPAEEVLKKIEGFAAKHGLPLTTAGPTAAAFQGQPLLAACHLPAQNLFIYCEEPQLQARAAGAAAVEIAITGPFRARRLPCREVDLVLHLTPAAVVQLLSYIDGLARAEG